MEHHFQAAVERYLNGSTNEVGNYFDQFCSLMKYISAIPFVHLLTENRMLKNSTVEVRKQTNQVNKNRMFVTVCKQIEMCAALLDTKIEVRLQFINVTSSYLS